MRKAYEYEAEMPNGLLHHVGDEQVVPFSGADGHDSLPPLKTSTGLRAPLELMNPYLDQRDASYVYSDDCCATNNGNMFPPYDTTHEPVSHDSFAPEFDTKPWQLGEKDLMSMFNDYFHDGYVAELDTALKNASQFASILNELDSVFNPTCEEAYNIDTYVQSEVEVMDARDSWMNYTFQQTQDSKEWTENQLDEVSYHWLHEACQPADILPMDVNPEEYTSK